MAPAAAAMALALALLLAGAAARTTTTTATVLSGEGAASTLSLPVPSQFEVAMLETLLAVKEGRAQDPRERRYDGTPGTILDALFPEGFSAGEEGAEEGGGKGRQESKGRRLRAANPFSRNLGAYIPFPSGPTLAALNSTFYRYASVSAPTDVNWMATIYNTPVQFQADCSSCWIFAVADTIAIAYGISSRAAGIAPGIQEFCDCSGMTCCSGGWPESSFAWFVANGNVTTRDAYTYWGQDGRTCGVDWTFPIAGKITGWERVPPYDQKSLMKAVAMQPVMVYISASATDFKNYTSTAPGTPGFKIYDGSCNNEVNHAVVVVGYNTTSSIDYWIVKNTWHPAGWGYNGYMFIRMLDGSGKCGMMTVPPLFPVNFPYAPVQVTVAKDSSLLMADAPWWQTWSPTAGINACSGVINPCGGGSCYMQGGVARCICPTGYVESVGVPTSKCVDMSPCTSGMVDPCGAGWCMDVGDGSYVCGCPVGYAVGARASGSPTCVPTAALGIKANTYVAQYGDTCPKVQGKFNLTASQFTALNPYIKCNKFLVPGLVVNIAPATGQACTQQYAVRVGDTCSAIEYYMDNVPSFSSTWLYPWTYGYIDGNLATVSQLPFLNGNVPTISGYNKPYGTTNLMALNPTLNCSSLMLSQLVCISSATSAISVTTFACGVTYTTVAGDSCASIKTSFKLNETYFRQLNPAINCNFQGGYFNDGVQICTGPASPVATVTCTQQYTVQQGDSCAQIWNAANLTQYQLLYINPGLQCQNLYIGQQICIDSPSLDSIADPNFLIYTIQPGDTWSYIQAQYTPKCKADSILVDRIASQNNISDWTTYVLAPNRTLVIPCTPMIGADCGCVASLPVCGNTFVNYASYCDARCNFATPVTNAACTTCQNACQGRYGQAPSPTSACTSGYVCPWPTWPPPNSDASAVYTTSPLCSYRQQTCQRACTMYNVVYGLTSTNTGCYNSCMACSRVPCSGPSDILPLGYSPCNAGSTCGATTGCANYGKSTTTCVTVCSYWNSFWTPLNP